MPISMGSAPWADRMNGKLVYGQKSMNYIPTPVKMLNYIQIHHEAALYRSKCDNGDSISPIQNKEIIGIKSTRILSGA